MAYFFVGFTVAPLQAVVSSIWPHHHVPLDNITFYLAPLVILSSILPHGCAPPAYCFLFNPTATPFWHNIFLFGPTVAPLTSPLASMYLANILWALSQIYFYSGVCLASALASALGESIGKQFGRWDEPYVHHSYVVGIDLFVLQCFFLIWYLCARGFILPCFASKACHSYKLHFCVERHRWNHNSPWICSALLSPTAILLMSGTSFLPRSTVLFLLSFTLNQASTTTRHSIMPSRRNGKFTCLGFVRGCLIGLALLINFLVLWFVERINIKLSTEVLRSLSSILWQIPSLVPAYHSHSRDLPSLKHYFALGPPTLSSSCSRYPISTPPAFFYAMHMALSDYVQHIERSKNFCNWLQLWQKVSGICRNAPQFFFLGLLGRWRANSCLFRQWSSFNISMITFISS